MGAERGGELAPGLDAAAEAARLQALSHGLGASVLVGQRTAAADMVMLHYYLDLLFPRCATATTQAARTGEAGAT